MITGGARGIGRVIASSLSKKEWSVAAAYRSRDQDALSLETELRERGGFVLTVCADVSSPDEAERLVHRVQKHWGRIDALVNCAGPYHRVPILEESIKGWRSAFENNLHPVFYLSRLVAEGMMDRGWGRIVNFGVANAGQLAGQQYVTAYYAAKVAVLVLTKSLAKALAPHGITVNAISPGVIDSGSIPLSEFSTLVKNIPAGYPGTPRDVAEVVCFLLSDEARYVTGANIPVSGGWGV